MREIIRFVLIALGLGLASCAAVSQDWLQVKTIGDARMNVNYFVNRR